MRGSKRRLQSSLVIVGVALWLITTAAPATADGGDVEFQGRIAVEPSLATGSTAACASIPAVHHRMYGIRGARLEDGDENTIWGMQQTYNDGVRWFETDLQQLLSKQDQRARRAGLEHNGRHGKLVLFHDVTLDRTTNDTGFIRTRTYEELPLTSTGRRIPTLNQALRWISEHPGTHLLVEIKMPLRWSRVNLLLEKFGFVGTNRVIFDTAKVDGAKNMIAVEAAAKLHATTGVKTWPTDKPAAWLTQFGTSVRLTYSQATENLAALREAGMRHRFSKIANGSGDQTAEEQWAALVTSGAFRYIITERSREYLEWCAAQQPPGTATANPVVAAP